MKPGKEQHAAREPRDGHLWNKHCQCDYLWTL